MSSEVRKRLLKPQTAPGSADGALDIGACAVMAFSSEDPAHPFESILDGHSGPGGSYWSSARPDVTEHLIIEFDAPQSLSRLVYEVEESQLERTQEVRIEVSQDRGLTYRGVLTQDYTFSPRGATFQREDVRLEVPVATHIRLTIVPNKNGSGRAALTSLRIFR
jgi:hypothetical protein